MKKKQRSSKNVLILMMILFTILTVNAFVDRVTYVDYQKTEKSNSDHKDKPKVETGENKPGR
ncbi:hypothetical protein KG090_05065 [Carnobacteriaceae bacterium zg-ZUI240]|nr:hypothetical protein [Carnobacteriaceae bacterium zg-ZUI240]